MFICKKCCLLHEQKKPWCHMPWWRLFWLEMRWYVNDSYSITNDFLYISVVVTRDSHRCITPKSCIVEPAPSLFISVFCKRRLRPPLVTFTPPCPIASHLTSPPLQLFLCKTISRALAVVNLNTLQPSNLDPHHQYSNKQWNAVCSLS